MNKAILAIFYILLVSFCISYNTYALPELQLNILGGEYFEDFNGDGDVEDPFDESIVVMSPTFTLQAF